MPRATNNPASKARRKKILKSAKGYYGRSKSTIRAAQRAVDRAGQYSYRDRRVRRREFRRLWIIRINAAVRPHGLSYSRFMYLLKEKEIGLDRKTLAYLAFEDIDAFNAIVAEVL
ncbi:MAG: 50S ribosomal protein L20 [Candidatus Electryonea clarkiae]|nr:50S ribosomal protein L20 [Candidatus Electryonea clarkiae]MDP8287776.1 50S ribosomal protein L20 [Candidatus Electryonea clarkiae]